MNNAKVPYDYESYLLQAMPTSGSGEISIHLSVEHPGEVGFLVIEPGIKGKEEVIYYHRKEGNIVYTYHVNRTNPITHPVNSQVITGGMAYLNYLISNTFEQNHITKIDNKNFSIKGGPFYIDGMQVVVPPFTTLNNETQQLVNNSENFVYVVEDGNGGYKYKLTDQEDSNEYQVAKVSTDVTGNIIGLDNTKTFPLGSGLSDELVEKLKGIEAGAEVNVQADWNEADEDSDAFIKNKPSIPDPQKQADWSQANENAIDYIKNKPDLSVYQLIENLLNQINYENPSDTKYLTEAAIVEALNKKVDKEDGKGLSANDFTDYYKNLLDNLKEPEECTTYIGGPGISIKDTKDPNVKIIETYDSPLVPTDFCTNAIIFPTEAGGGQLNEGSGDRYITLSDGGRTSFWGEVTTKNEQTKLDKVKVYVKDFKGVSIQVETLIKAYKEDGTVVKHLEPMHVLPVSVVNGVGYFELSDASFEGIDLTQTDKLHVIISRVPTSARSCAEGGVNITGMTICFKEDISDLEAESGSVILNKCDDQIIDVKISYPDFLLQVYDEQGFRLIPEDIEGTRLSFDSAINSKIIALPGRRYNGSGQTWTITHNFDSQDILSNVIVDGSVVIPEDFRIIDNDTVEVVFDQEVSGDVILTTGTRYEGTGGQTWTINHDSGFEDIYVEFYNNDGYKIFPEDAQVIDKNVLEVNFDQEQNGFAILRYIKYNIDKATKEVCCCPKKFMTYVGDGVNKVFMVEHNLTRPLYSVMAKKGNIPVMIDWREVNPNTLEITMEAPEKISIFIIA